MIKMKVAFFQPIRAGLEYFKPPSNLRDSYISYFEVNLHFLSFEHQLKCSYLY